MKKILMNLIHWKKKNHLMKKIVFFSTFGCRITVACFLSGEIYHSVKDLLNSCVDSSMKTSGKFLLSNCKFRLDQHFMHQNFKILEELWNCSLAFWMVNGNCIICMSELDNGFAAFLRISSLSHVKFPPFFSNIQLTVKKFL